MSFLFHTSGSVGDLGGQPPRSTRPGLRAQAEVRTSCPEPTGTCSQLTGGPECSLPRAGGGTVPAASRC